MKTREREMKAPQKRWGIVVGVDKYDNANEFLHNLQGCVVDAHEMYETMMNVDCCRFVKEHVKLLENPTYGDLEEAFVEVGASMGPGDELWFYFAGHGYSDKKRSNGYLLLSGAKYDKRGFLRGEGSMSSGQLGDIVAEHITARGATVVLFLDCCCAASVALNTGDRAVHDVELEDIATSFRDISLASCGEDVGEPVRLMSFMATGKYGRAHESCSGGAFTKRLIEGLLGGTKEHPTTYDSFYVTAGALGVYLGAGTQMQCPTQNVADPMYPLSIAPKKKAAFEQMKVLDGNVGKWLMGLRGCMHDKQFAERVLAQVEHFEYDDVMCNVLRLVADPNCTMPVGGENAARLLEAFRVLKGLLEKDTSREQGVHLGSMEKKTARPPVPKPRIADGPEGGVPLSPRDRDILADVENRLREVDGDDGGLSGVGRMTQAEAASALDSIARRRMRVMCNRARYDALFSPNEQAKWSMNARDGFSSVFEAAVYELVRDDKALTSRSK